MFKGKSKFVKALIILFLAGYLGAAGVLIYEAATPGNESADKSSRVGDEIASVINSIGEPSNPLIEPTKLTIKNKIESAKIGDTYQIETEIEPDDTSFLNVVYEVDHPELAALSDTGFITFLKEGDVTFTAYSGYNEALKDSFSVHISPIAAESLSLSIHGVTPDSDDIYHLSMKETSYSIEEEILPSNASNQEVIYTLDNESYIRLHGKTIHLLSDSEGNIVTIQGKLGDLEATLKVEVLPYEIPTIPLESVSFASSTLNLGLTQSNSPSLIYSPSDAMDASRASFSFSSDDPSIASVSSSGSIKGLKEGSTMVHAVYKKDHSIQASLTVNVSYIPLNNPSSLRLNVQEYIEMNDRPKATIAGWNPSNASAKALQYYRFASLDPSIATISSNGTITPKAVGSCAIEARIYDSKTDYDNDANPVATLNKTITVFVSDTILSFALESHVARQSGPYAILDLNEEYLYSDIEAKNIKVGPSFVGTPSLDLTYELAAIDDGLIFESDGSSFRVSGSKAGCLTLRAIDSGSEISSTISFLFVKETKHHFDTSGFLVGDEFNILLDVVPSLTYQASLVEGHDVVVQEEQILDYQRLHYWGINEGDCLVKVTPYFEGNALESESFTIAFHVSHKRVADFVFSAYKGEEKLGENPTVFLNDQISLSVSYLPFAHPTDYCLLYETSDETIASIDNDILSFHKIGSVTIQAKEEVSNITHSITFRVVNLSLLKEDKPFTLEGVGSSKKDKIETNRDGRIVLTQGHSYQLSPNFSEDSTYRKATYSSNDEEILKIGKDGMITPLAEGNVVISIKVEDNDSISFTKEIEIHVNPRSVIENINAFNAFIRKLLGHFTAFLILGIFSTMFYLLAFDQKHWLWSTPVNFLSGFALAGITELIQLYTPGRAGVWSDVWLDFRGFISSAIVLTVLYIGIYYLVRYLKERKKGKEEKK